MSAKILRGIQLGPLSVRGLLDWLVGATWDATGAGLVNAGRDNPEIEDSTVFSHTAAVVGMPRHCLIHNQISHPSGT